MKTPSETVLSWAIEAVMPGAGLAALTDVVALRDGRSPWLLRLTTGGAVVECVLRESDPVLLRTEAAALRTAADHGVPAPRLLAVDLDGAQPAIVTTRLAGSSSIPRRPDRRLRDLGAIAARLHDIKPSVDDGLRERLRPISGVNFDDLLDIEPDPDPLLAEASAAVAGRRADEPHGFVHGDLWHGNTMWFGNRLSGLIDWDCAGIGPAGIDLASLRFDAALCFGLAAATEVSAGWTGAAGRPADNVAYWDLIAALNTPPNMGWLVEMAHEHGRADLSRSMLIERRSAFVAAALRGLGA